MKSYNNSEFKDDIYFLGYISKSDKEILYSISSVFVYPSYYEGFGFPVLEAMVYGLPVICSNISSLPEIVADAHRGDVLRRRPGTVLLNIKVDAVVQLSRQRDHP